jgi:RNA polymerase sigma-70 factor (ECF subfamily)
MNKLLSSYRAGNGEETIISDGDLVRAVLKDGPGRDDAFDELFRRYEGMVRHRAIRAGTPISDVDDVTQTVFLHAFMHLAELEAPDAFRHWLMTIVRYDSIHQRKRRKRETPFSVLEHAMDSPVDFGDTNPRPIDRLISSEREKLLKAGIAHLSPLLQETMRRHYFDHRTIRQIATEDGDPEGTIKRRLHVGRRRVKGVLEDRWPTEFTD